MLRAQLEAELGALAMRGEPLEKEPSVPNLPIDQPTPLGQLASAVAEMKKKLRNPRVVSDSEGRVPSASISPNTTQTPALNGSSNRKRRNSPTTLVRSMNISPDGVFRIDAIPRAHESCCPTRS